MNAKHCKKLRRAAERATVGMPSRQLLAQNTQKFIGTDARGRKYYAVRAINNPRSTRAIYHRLKREVA